MTLAIRLLFIHFMALDHILTSILHIHHKQALDLIGITHHVPALYRSYKILVDENFWNDKNNYLTTESRYMITYSCAYFLYEFFYYIKHRCPLRSLFELQMFIHAFMSCMGFYYVYNLQKYHFYIAAFLTWEASTPFLNLGNYLYRNDFSNTLVYKINGIFFISTFVIFRIILGSYIFWWHLWSQVNFGLKLSGVTLNVLNFIWLNNIIKRIM